MRQARIYEYHLPMDSGVILRDRHLSHRDGWIVELTEDNRQGLGEIAPLLGFSQEDHHTAGEQLQAAAMAWVSHHPFDEDEFSPSVAWGMSVAMAELAQTLPMAANCDAVPLCFGDPDDLVVQLADKKQPLAKMKVGLYEAIRDGMMTSLFLEAIPELSLRLDANRQWTSAKAQQFARYVSPELRSRIAFIEEPCRTPEASLAFSKETGIAIAWDETTRDPNFEVKAEDGVAAIVIKPMLVGALSKCLRWIAQAHDCGLAVVISSSLESSLGLYQLARLAAWQTPNSAPGLDTLSLFQTQLHTAWPNSPLPLTSLSDLPVVWESKRV